MSTSRNTKPIIIFKHGYTEGGFKKIESILEKLNLPYLICQLEMNDTLPKPEETAGAILMGGPMGAYEEEKHPWLKVEKQWVKDAMAQNLPIFGICLGCQILAELNGGEAYEGEHGLSVGFREAHLHVCDDPIFGNELEGAYVYAWHKDTFNRGNGQRLMEGVVYNEQAAKFGQNIYGVQFHPEATEEVVEKWYARDEKCDLANFNNYPPLEEEKMLMAKYLPPVHNWLENFLQRLFIEK